MIFYRPPYTDHKAHLVHVFVSNKEYVIPGNVKPFSTDYRDWGTFRKIYSQVKPWQCIAPKELGVWSDEDSDG